MKTVQLGAGERLTVLNLNREGAVPLKITRAAQDIIEGVRASGDEALRRYCKDFDGVEVDEFRLPQERIDAALDNIDPAFLAALEKAAEQIRDFHQREVQQSWFTTRADGTMLGVKVTPVRAAGIYVPGGRAQYPSTVLMNAVPAKVAGVERVVMVTPPQRDGGISPYTLTAAKVAGVDEVYTVGGAQAIAALAYGTQSIPRVEKITGPGNAYVAAAKRLVSGEVGIDMIAGPSEVLVLADDSANPEWLAADMLSQAEHDALASAICITDNEALAHAVIAELERQSATLPRADIVRKSLADWSAVVLVPDMDAAIAIANRVAPEHLEVLMREPWSVLPRIRHAGAVFLGPYAPEPLGDYFAGPNHVLPTLGTARFSSALSVQTFCKRTSIIAASPAFAAANADAVARLARMEQLEAHARSMECRKQ